jgi:hypothetical protein
MADKPSIRQVNFHYDPCTGLVLELNIEDHEYLGELTEEAGVRVVLHEPGAMPFPYEEGFSVAPGMATSVGITKVRNGNISIGT